MADGGEDDEREGRDEGSVLDEFSIGDTVGSPADTGNGHHTGPTDEGDGPQILTPTERAERSGDADADDDLVRPTDFEDGATAFEETLRFRQRWLWAAVLGVSTLSVVTWAANPTGAILTVVLLGVPVVGTLGTLVARLETRVDEAGVHLRLFPLHRTERTVAFGDVTGVETTTVDPFPDFGGIGIRRARGTWAYVVERGSAVRLERADTTDVLLSTRRPEELERAVQVGMTLSRGVDAGLDERWRAVANFDDSRVIED